MAREYVFIDPVSGRDVNIGYLCKRWRIGNEYNLSQVAEDTNYSQDNIIKFEQGKNNNLNIFLWYVEHGFEVKKYLDKGVNAHEVAINN